MIPIDWVVDTDIIRWEFTITIQPLKVLIISPVIPYFVLRYYPTLFV